MITTRPETARIADVQQLGREQKAEAAATLAEAFLDDPMMALMAPDRSRRMEVGLWFFGLTVEYGLRWGEVWGNSDASAVAVWFPPGNDWRLGRMLRVGMAAIPLRIGLRSTLKALAADTTVEDGSGGGRWHDDLRHGASTGVRAKRGRVTHAAAVP